MTLRDINPIVHYTSVYARIHPCTVQKTAKYGKNKGYKSGLRFLVAQPFGLKLRISVDNYPINKTYNDASRFIPT